MPHLETRIRRRRQSANLRTARLRSFDTAHVRGIKTQEICSAIKTTPSGSSRPAIRRRRLDLPIRSADLRHQEIAAVDPQLPSELVGQQHEARNLVALGEPPQRLEPCGIAVPKVALGRWVDRDAIVAPAWRVAGSSGPRQQAELDPSCGIARQLAPLRDGPDLIAERATEVHEVLRLCAEHDFLFGTLRAGRTRGTVGGCGGHARDSALSSAVSQ